MPLRSLFRFVCLVLLLLQARAAVTPNIVLIVADDLGWRELSVQGSAFYETPRIDSLAANGVRFTQGYATFLRTGDTRPVERQEGSAEFCADLTERH